MDLAFSIKDKCRLCAVDLTSIPESKILYLNDKPILDRIKKYLQVTVSLTRKYHPLASPSPPSKVPSNLLIIDFIFNYILTMWGPYKCTGPTNTLSRTPHKHIFFLGGRGKNMNHTVEIATQYLRNTHESPPLASPTPASGKVPNNGENSTQCSNNFEDKKKPRSSICVAAPRGNQYTTHCALIDAPKG